MYPSFRSLVPTLLLLTTTAVTAAAQTSEEILDQVRVLTPHQLRALVDVAESGDTLAQYKVGLAYYYGYAVEAMPEQAAEWFRRAADAGSAAGQHMLGVQLRDGNGVEQDVDEALRMLRTAAQRGNADAQYDYGLMLFDGVGTPQDYAAAYALFRQAAEQGAVEARTYVGVMLVNGLGVDADPAAGSEELRQAARRGSAMAQANLGALYANGVGVEQDANEALVWFYMAEANGFDGVGPLIADMTQSMSEDEITDVRREAQERSERFLSDTQGGQMADATPQDDAETAEWIRELGDSLKANFPELGSFIFSVRSDVARALSGMELNATVRGRRSISEVSVDGCRLHWTDVTVLGNPSRWEWFIDLGTIDPALLRVDEWMVPEGWRLVEGQVYAVYMEPRRDEAQSFVGIGPDQQQGYVHELAVPFRNRRAADEIMEKLREASRLCAGR